MNLVCVFKSCIYIIQKDFTDCCVPKSSITTLWTQKWRRINLSQNLRQMYPAPPEMNYVVVSLIIATMSPYVCANYLCHSAERLGQHYVTSNFFNIKQRLKSFPTFTSPSGVTYNLSLTIILKVSCFSCCRQGKLKKHNLHVEVNTFNTFKGL